MKKSILLFTAVPYLISVASCHRQHCVEAVESLPCQTLTARADFQIFTQQGQATALIANCPNETWRLVIKADWGATFLDILHKNGKISVIQQPVGLTAKEIKAMSESLTTNLAAPTSGQEIKLITPHSKIDFTILSQKELAGQQRQKLLME